ncbi:peptidoglycan recognition protein family protein [Nitrospirillum pindoramense]|uniref:peptidoglycan recognition protein family protein n=1 Tax=Nitrospirillum amazonense TaxID=28077 RepID=UPI0011A91376|nr:peptidoglycan recognition family protein [Nitrospirillum amazonense]
MVIDDDGWVIDPRVKKTPFFNLKHGLISVIHGIIVHQTASPSAQSTFNSYKSADPNGAHFLIDKDGTIYQTASVTWKLWHVGILKPRCILTLSCPEVETKALTSRPWNAMTVHRIEKEKNFPDRFPMNDDAIGIELVGSTIDKSKDAHYEPATQQQNDSLKWLVSEISIRFRLPPTEIWRHPDVSYKSTHEAETAKW